MPRILLVEDDADVRLIIEHVLIDAGYDVDTSGTANGGKALLRCLAYDVVLADARLPDGTGMEVADAAADEDTKALIITAYAFTLPAATSERYDVLLKPMRPAELVAAIERVLRD